MKLLSEFRKKKSAVFTFGRMNPPTIGHEKLINKVLHVAQSKGADAFIYCSYTQDPAKNPLSNSDKVRFLKLGIPHAGKAIKVDPKVRTPFEAVSRLIELGYDDITMVVGEDRVKKFRDGIAPYVNTPESDVESFEVISAGERDPDDEGVSGMSASKMREAASKNNLKSFLSGVPSGLSDRFAKEMFNLVRRGMKIAEEFQRNLKKRNK